MQAVHRLCPGSSPRTPTIILNEHRSQTLQGHIHKMIPGWLAEHTDLRLALSNTVTWGVPEVLAMLDTLEERIQVGWGRGGAGSASGCERAGWSGCNRSPGPLPPLCSHS
jgi:hypothetical protein